jgi:hypothetical protein
MLFFSIPIFIIHIVVFSWTAIIGNAGTDSSSVGFRKKPEIQLQHSHNSGELNKPDITFTLI